MDNTVGMIKVNSDTAVRNSRSPVPNLHNAWVDITPDQAKPWRSTRTGEAFFLAIHTRCPFFGGGAWQTTASEAGSKAFASPHNSAMTTRAVQSLNAGNSDRPIAQRRSFGSSDRSTMFIRTVRSLKDMNSDHPISSMSRGNHTFGSSDRSAIFIRTVRTFKDMHSDRPIARQCAFGPSDRSGICIRTVRSLARRHSDQMLPRKTAL